MSILIPKPPHEQAKLVGDLVVPRKYYLEMGFNESRLQPLCRSAATSPTDRINTKPVENKILSEKNTSIGFISGTTERGNQCLQWDIRRGSMEDATL